MVEDFLNDLPVIYHGNHPHGFVTDWAAHRVGVPDFQDKVAPFLGRQPLRRRRNTDDLAGGRGRGDWRFRVFLTF
jgi:hypothetical protein